MLANAIVMVIGFNDIATAGYLEKMKQISKNRLNVAACQQVNSPLWKTFQCTSEILLEQYCQALLCRSNLTQLRLRDTTAVTKLRVQSSGRQHQRWHYRPQDGGQPERTAHRSMTRPVCWITSAQRRCCCANMVASHIQVCAQAPGRRCQKRRSPFPKTEAGQRMAHHSERRSVYYTTSAQHCFCRTNVVLSHVHVCAQVSCERLDGKPCLRRRLADAERSLPVPAKVKRDLLHNPNIP
jgi:hypothetical protein